MTALDQPLTRQQAKKLVRAVVTDGTVSFTKHAFHELAVDKLTTVDAINTLRGGWLEEAEWENGAWRHQVRTHSMVLVIELDDSSSLTVITAWRLRR